MPQRILCIISWMNMGGAETFLMKLYRGLDRTRYQMDFCVLVPENFYAPEIERLGGRIYHKTKVPLLSLWQQYQLVKKGKYDCVMCVSEYGSAVLDLLVAKWAGAKQLVLRSTNSNGEDKMRVFWHEFLFKFLARRVPTVKIAPSELAARFTFGDDKEVHFLPNGLDIDQFAFSEENRAKIRQSIHLTDEFVVGHMGRFDLQKNHAFLLQIFAEIKKRRSNAVLFLAGKGKLQAAVEKQAAQLGVSDSVRFLGVRADAFALLSAMDVFVFPSLFEGMPNAVIEAQTNGLPCVISNTITPQVRQTDLVHFMGLNESAASWAEKALQVGAPPLTARPQAALRMRQAGYDIKDVVRQFTQWVFAGNVC